MEHMVFAVLLTALLAGLAVSGRSSSEEGVELTGVQRPVISPMDWGPVVGKTVLTLNGPVSPGSVTARAFRVTELRPPLIRRERQVLAAYPCDERGERVSGPSCRIALELDYGPDRGGAFGTHPVTGHSSFHDPYLLRIRLTRESGLTTPEGRRVRALQVEEGTDLRRGLIPSLEGVDLTGRFTGTDGETLSYGVFCPREDGKAHPLVIWLHGAGEGGTDPAILQLGNKVTALYGEAFQQAMGGAYVLTPQTPDYWMRWQRGKRWQWNPGRDSIFLPTLLQLIHDFIQSHPAIDRDRIYVAGCSNGGFMTVNLLLREPELFAAAVPICQAWPGSGFTEEDAARLAQIPLWFVYCQADTTVPPAAYSEPVIRQIQAAGGAVHTTVLDQVTDPTGCWRDRAGRPWRYDGHWAWIPFLDGRCRDGEEALWTWLARQRRRGGNREK